MDVLLLEIALDEKFHGYGRKKYYIRIDSYYKRKEIIMDFFVIYLFKIEKEKFFCGWFN